MEQQPAGDYPKVRQVDVSADEAGQRIDNFLARHLKGVPKSHIYRIIRRGEVRVNSGRVRAQYKLRGGDRVRIPPVRVSAASKPAARPVPGLEQRIVFENSRCLVVNKPSGLAVHGGSGVSYGVIEAFRVARPDAPYLELAHRLDRDTSGCLVIAKRRSFLRAFQQQLREGSVVKHYLALVAGAWQGGRQTVSAPLRKNTLRGGERMVMVDDNGKPAVSVFTPVTCQADSALVEVDLKTGRTHQIRVHGAYIGHPLVGDEKYGDANVNSQMRSYGLRRLFLQAHYLEFVDVYNDERITVTVPLDDELKTVLDSLE